MAEIPPIHICHSLSSENEILKTKYDKLKKKYKELQQSMLELKESLMRMQMEKEYNTRIEAKEVIVARARNFEEPKKNEVNKETTTSDKLLTLNNQLLKQFEKGNKQLKNSERKMLKIENEKEKLTSQLFEATQQIEFLKKQMEMKDEQFNLLNSKMKCITQSKREYSNQAVNIKKEKKKLLTENQKLKQELKGLDENFFDEIEDMKYALQQSAKLNTEYERTLRKLCKQFGLNYNTALLSSKKSEEKFEKRRTMRKYNPSD